MIPVSPLDLGMNGEGGPIAAIGSSVSVGEANGERRIA